LVFVLVTAEKKDDLANASASDSEMALENSDSAVALLRDPAAESATASPSALVIVSTVADVSAVVTNPNSEVAIAVPPERDFE